MPSYSWFDRREVRGVYEYINILIVAYSLLTLRFSCPRTDAEFRGIDISYKLRAISMLITTLV
jgi:hypothetical protein